MALVRIVGRKKCDTVEKWKKSLIELRVPFCVMDVDDLPLSHLDRSAVLPVLYLAGMPVDMTSVGPERLRSKFVFLLWEIERKQNASGGADGQTRG